MVPFLIWVMLVTLVTVIGMWIKVLRVGGSQQAVARRYLLLLHILLAVAFICGVIAVVKEYFFTGEYATWSGVLGLVGTVSSVGLYIVVYMTGTLERKAGLLRDQIKDILGRIQEIEDRLMRGKRFGA